VESVRNYLEYIVKLVKYETKHIFKNFNTVIFAQRKCMRLYSWWWFYGIICSPSSRQHCSVPPV